MSRAAIHALEHVTRTFPDARAGRWNCRPIANSSIWSEHAWGNGLDITRGGYGYSTDPEHQSLLDETYAWLDYHRRDLSIRQILWRVKHHYNHIHVDFWPKGYATPPCAGGNLRMQYPSGRVVEGDPGPMFGPWEGEPIDMLARGDQGADVIKLQDYINRWIDAWFALSRPDWWPLTLDGSYGPQTAEAVATFQTWAELTVNGDRANAMTIGSLTLVLDPQTEEVPT